MKRAEHLQWCKSRAIEYVRAGDCSGAVASFMSDMSKHEETEDHPALGLMAMLLFTGSLSTRDEVEKFIEGFN